MTAAFCEKTAMEFPPFPDGMNLPSYLLHAGGAEKKAKGSVWILERYTERERWQIGKWIYEGKYTVAEAAEEFGVNFYTARDYLRKYKAHLKALEKSLQQAGELSFEDGSSYEGLLRRRYSQMDKDELIEELIREKCK